MAEFLKSALFALMSGSVAAAIITAFLRARTAKIEQELKHEFDRLAAIANSQRSWKEQCVSELLGPVYIHLDRTGRAFKRWSNKNLYLEAKVVGAGNEAIRVLLLGKAHLIPPDLLDDAGLLLEHYDRWFEEFEKVRSAESANTQDSFVFVGPAGYPFPRSSADRFQTCFRHYWIELYGQEASSK